MREPVIRLGRDDLMYDVASLAYVAADLREGEATAHRLHQTFDICEGGNRDRILRVMGCALAAVNGALAHVTLGHHSHRTGVKPLPARIEITFRPGVLKPATITMLAELVREHLVSSALADWLEMTLPGAAEIWRQRAESSLAAIYPLARTTRGRYVPPI